MRPCISIIIPIYNNEKYIERCANSVCTQTIQNVEVILVDDGSTDGSGKICDELSGRDDRIKVVHKRNGGISSARLSGMSLASAEWIGFVDGDDWVEGSMYELLYNRAVNQQADVVIQGYTEEVGDRCVPYTNYIRDGIYDGEDKKMYFIRDMICCGDFFCMGIQPYLVNKLFKKDLLWSHLQNMDLRIKVGEDAAVTFPVLMKAERIAVTSDCCYHYCLRKDSVMYKERDEGMEYGNAMLLHRFLKKNFLQCGYYEAVRNDLDRYTIHNLLTRAMGYVVKEIDIPSHKEIVIYGAGAFGKSLYLYLESQSSYHVCLWVDKKAEQLAQMGFPVSGPGEIEVGDDILILIALLSENAVRDVKSELERIGVRTDQLVWAMDVLRLAEVEL